MKLLRSLAMLLVTATLVTCSAPPASLYPGTASAQLFVRSDDQQRLGPAGKLSDDQLKRLRAAIHALPQVELGPACFVPHHFFRMYDAAGQKIGEIAVCFCCRGVQAKPILPISENLEVGADYEALAALVRELGSTPKLNCGPNEVEGD